MTRVCKNHYNSFKPADMALKKWHVAYRKIDGIAIQTSEN